MTELDLRQLYARRRLFVLMKLRRNGKRQFYVLIPCDYAWQRFQHFPIPPFTLIARQNKFDILFSSTSNIFIDSSLELMVKITFLVIEWHRQIIDAIKSKRACPIKSNDIFLAYH